MYSLTFSKAGREDIVLTEDDLFDFHYEASCFSGESFELGGVNAAKLYLLIDNNTQRFSRGTFANARIKLEIDGEFIGNFTAELPKRRNGVIELTAYDDMIKLDVEYPSDYQFPQVFWNVYAQCAFEAGLAPDTSLDNVVLNGVWNNGIISHEYTDYIYANSCRKLVSGMAEWNGGYARINDDGKLQIDKFSKTVTKQYSSGNLMEFDYSDETVTFSKIKSSQKNKTYEKGTDDGYTLVINNQYISYGLEDGAFEQYFDLLYEYYSGFSLTPMSFTLADPDFDLKIGDRIEVYDEEENVTVTGNVSKIEIDGNCSMTVTCGGFENVSSASNYTPTSFSQTQQSKQSAMNEPGIARELVNVPTEAYPAKYSMAFDKGGSITVYDNTSDTAAEKGSLFFGGTYFVIRAGNARFTVDNDAVTIRGNNFNVNIENSSSQKTLQYYYGNTIAYKRNPLLKVTMTDKYIEITMGRQSDGNQGKLKLSADGLYFNGKKVLTE